MGTTGFNKAAEPLPQTDFAAYLEQIFGGVTARDVLKTFDRLGLAAPENEIEFVLGTEGVLVFLNRYGVVIRIEHDDKRADIPREHQYDRINDSPWVLRPLASLKTGDAIFEICPGCATSDDKSESFALAQQLRLDGINFWDEGAHNTGKVRLRTPAFPHGITVVIDRGAVNRLTAAVSATRHALAERAAETAAAEEALQDLYGPLCDVFLDRWQSGARLTDFWRLCRDYTAAGKLVAGWNEGAAAAEEEDGYVSKQSRAVTAAAAYEKNLRRKDKPAAAPEGLAPR